MQLQCSSPPTDQQEAQDAEPVSHDSQAGRACGNNNPAGTESHTSEAKQSLLTAMALFH